MRKWLFILCIISCTLCYADKVEHENVLRVAFGGEWMQDQYLSPLLYKGYRVGIGNEWWQPFRRTDTISGSRWEHVGQLDLQGMWAYNPVKTNAVYAIGARGGWGAYYVWKLKKQGLSIFVGPYLEADYVAKWHVVSVNKPYSMDIAIDLMAMACISYAFKAKRTSYRLQYSVRANVIGVDYLPDYWQSYYEMTEGVLGIVRCSGMWNHRTLRHGLTFDMQLPHSTWRLGIEHEYLEYGIKDMMFSREQVSVVVGTVFRYKIRPNRSLVEF